LKKYLFGVLLAVTSVYASSAGLGVKWLDMEQRYTVEDPSQNLKATLVFPSESAVGVFEASARLGQGDISFSAEVALASKYPRGTDTDWQNGMVTVYSDSKTTLDSYYHFTLSYDRPLYKHWNVGIAFFHNKSRLVWSDTHQADYVNGTYIEVDENTVRFTQKRWGTDLSLKYGDTLVGFPVSVELGWQRAWHESVDEHLNRSFYTVSENWLNGYSAVVEVTIYSQATSKFTVEGYYCHVGGNGEMEFYTTGGVHYWTLPAEFETRSQSLSLHFHHHF
jgi:hypothetical protein